MAECSSSCWKGGGVAAVIDRPAPDELLRQSSIQQTMSPLQISTRPLKLLIHDGLAVVPTLLIIIGGVLVALLPMSPMSNGSPVCRYAFTAAAATSARPVPQKRAREPARKELSGSSAELLPERILDQEDERKAGCDDGAGEENPPPLEATGPRGVPIKCPPDAVERQPDRPKAELEKNKKLKAFKKEMRRGMRARKRDEGSCPDYPPSVTRAVSTSGEPTSSQPLVSTSEVRGDQVAPNIFVKRENSGTQTRNLRKKRKSAKRPDDSAKQELLRMNQRSEEFPSQ